MLAVALVGGTFLGASPPARAEEPALDVVFVLDTSSSMARNDPKRLVSAATSDFVKGLSDDDGAGLVLFGASARAPRALAPLSAPGQREALAAEIARIQYTDRLTDMAAGIERGLYELRQHGRSGSLHAIVFMSDGIVDTGSAGRDEQRVAWLRKDLLADAERDGVKIIAVAFSEEADFMLIREMAVSTGGEYYRCASAADVAQAFGQIAAKLTATAPPRAEIAPAPPAPATADIQDRGGSTGRTVAWVVGGALACLLVAGLMVGTRRRAARRRSPEAPDSDDERMGARRPQAALLDCKTGRYIPITKRTITVGRDGSCDVVILSGMVSAVHARVEFKDGHYAVTDLRSTNGTFVNGKKITGECLLRDGDTLSFDEFRYQFLGGAQKSSGTVVREVSIPVVPSPEVASGDNQAPGGKHKTLVLDDDTDVDMIG
jgi:hypothetical protein